MSGWSGNTVRQHPSASGVERPCIPAAPLNVAMCVSCFVGRPCLAAASLDDARLSCLVRLFSISMRTKGGVRLSFGRLCSLESVLSEVSSFEVGEELFGDLLQLEGLT